MVNEPLSLTTTTSFIVVCGVCFLTVVQRRKLVVWQTGSKTANVDSVESTTPPISKPLNNIHGYPGAVSNTPTYILMSETTMKLNMEASAENKNTPINLAQNMYWNLAGNNSWNILDHMIQIWGPHITLDPHTDHARSLRERDLLSLSPQEMDRRVYRRGGYQIRS
ncbi:hypothetical protein Bca4012_071070 [Brassica carinata]|uniref:(rape) hypothetical protein n=1 Tax=Brassica napus TaxID=3708 RepID=A0A078I3R5_BRANA|nr:unnamed protein product [Brassica napus]CDY44189.1 BnaC05g15460D [Brassica napus]